MTKDPFPWLNTTQSILNGQPGKGFLFGTSTRS